MRRIPAATIAAVLLAGCPALNLLGLSGTTTVSGTVKAELTNQNAFLGPGDSYRIASFTSEQAMPGGTVKVTDTSGADVGVGSATTDTSGNFTLTKVPTGKTLVIMATKGVSSTSASGSVTVEALWSSGSTRTLDTVSTMVADKCLHASSLTQAKLSALSQDKIAALETALSGAVGATSTIPDLTSLTDITAKFDAAAANSAAVASAYAALSQ